MVVVKSLFNKFYSKPIELYTSIEELPVNNWWKINETNDLKWVIKDEKEWGKADSERLREVFEEMRMQFMERYGVPETLQRILEIQREIMGHTLEMMKTKDYSIQNFIDICELQIKEIYQEQEERHKKQANNVLGYVERYMHRALDIKNTSVARFYDYLKMMEQENRYRQKIADNGRQQNWV